MLYLSVNFADSWSFAVACNTLQPLQSLHFNLVDSAPDCNFNRVFFFFVDVSGQQNYLENKKSF